MGIMSSKFLGFFDLLLGSDTRVTVHYQFPPVNNCDRMLLPRALEDHDLFPKDQDQLGDLDLDKLIRSF